MLVRVVNVVVVVLIVFIRITCNIRAMFTHLHLILYSETRLYRDVRFFPFYIQNIYYRLWVLVRTTS